MEKQLSAKEVQLLQAIKTGPPALYSHKVKELSKLHNAGFIRLILDEQGAFISARLTSEGIKILNSK